MSEKNDELNSKTTDELIELLLWKGDYVETESALKKLLAMGEPGIDAIVEYLIKLDYKEYKWDNIKRAMVQMGDAVFEQIADKLQYAEYGESRSEELFEFLESFEQTVVPYLIKIMTGELNEDFSGDAALSLGRLGGPQALQALLDANENCPPHLKLTKVHEGLALLSDKNADAVLFKALESSNEEESNAALMAMINNPAAKYIESLALVLKETSGYHASEDASREEIIDSLADTLEESVIPILENFKDDKDKDVRKAVRRNLLELKKKITYKKKTTGSGGERIWVFEPESFHHDDGMEFSTIVLKGNVLTGMVRSLANWPRKYNYEIKFAYELDYYDKAGYSTGGSLAVRKLNIQLQRESSFEIKLNVPKNCFRAELSSIYARRGKLVYRSWQGKARDIVVSIVVSAIIIGLAAVAFYYYIDNY